MITMAAEGGIPFLVLALMLACAALGRPVLRNRSTVEQRFRWAASAATIVAVIVMASVDNVLLVEPTALCSAAAIGTLAAREPVTFSFVFGEPWLRWVRVAILGTVGALCIARLAAQTTVAWLYASGVPVERLERLAKVDRGEYWLEMTLAFRWLDRGRCDLARRHARESTHLFPSAGEPKVIEVACGQKDELSTTPIDQFTR